MDFVDFCKELHAIRLSVTTTYIAKMNAVISETLVEYSKNSNRHFDKKKLVVWMPPDLCIAQIVEAHFKDKGWSTTIESEFDDEGDVVGYNLFLHW